MRRAVRAQRLSGALPLTADVLYSVTTLQPTGASGLGASALNNAGQVVGIVDTPDGSYYPFLYSNGQFTSLQSVSPGSLVSGINNSGQILIGVSIYGNGQLTDLSTVGGRSIFLQGINDAGQVTGGFLAGGLDAAFLYSNGQWKNLGTVAGNFVGDRSVGYAINNAGQVTGDVTDGTSVFIPSRAFIYTNGQMQTLGTLGGYQSYERAINNAGQVVGSSTVLESYTPVHAFLYSNGQMADLGTLGGPESSADGINDAGQCSCNQ